MTPPVAALARNVGAPLLAIVIAARRADAGIALLSIRSISATADREMEWCRAAAGWGARRSVWL